MARTEAEFRSDAQQNGAGFGDHEMNIDGLSNVNCNGKALVYQGVGGSVSDQRACKEQIMVRYD